ncbi:MAG: methyltransferase domain-containing protein [Thermoflexales bacterium]|nr:methyltransferase domain-containing protein [Thermoflexales bacterium]
MRDVEPQSVAQMRADWDQRAKLDALHFICSERDTWALAEFIQSGEDDIERYLMPHVRRAGHDPALLRALDFGCGVGRLSAAMARRFKTVTAVDLSGEMLARGRALFPDLSNVCWMQGNGIDLRPLADASHDVVFSYLVLQHVPEVRLALGYVAEFCRVLAPGGILCIQFSHRSAYALRRLYVALRARLARVDWLWYGFAPARWRQRRYGHEEITGMETLMQHSLHPDQVARVVCERGLVIDRLDVTNPLDIWLVALKPNARAT